MGKITVFTLDDSPASKQAKDLLSGKGLEFLEVSLTSNPAWKPLLYLLTKGWQTAPQVFFNDRLIGGFDRLEQLETAGQLDGMIKDCLEAKAAVAFPPELRTPKGSEFVEVIPKELREKWQREFETELGPKLGGTTEKPISSIMIVMDTPGTEMAVACSVGPGAAVFPLGMCGPKGGDDDEDKFYCQVAITEKKTLFLDGPSTYPKGLKENIDWVQFGYGWYLGAPWQVRDIKGTVVALEKEAGILKQEHQPIVEAFRDKVIKELNDYLAKAEKDV